MDEFFENQLNQLREELGEEVLSIIEKVLDLTDVNPDRIVERLCLASGISQDHLEAILSGEEEDLTVQEIHSLCNAISFSFTDDYEEADEEVREILDRCDDVIAKWVDTVNDYYNRPDTVFNELLYASGIDQPADFFRTYHIFMDDTALCDDRMEDVLKTILPEIKLAERPLKITVPKAVIDLLENMPKDQEHALLFGTDTGLRNLQMLQKEGILSVRGDSADTTVMSTFLSAFSRFKPQYKMVLITDDESLAKAVQMLNSSGIEGEDILVSKVTQDGKLALWFDYDEDEDVEDADSTATGENDDLMDKDLLDEFSVDEEADDFLSGAEHTGEMSDEDYGEADEKAQTDREDMKDFVSDAEKMAMLEEQLANMLEKGDFRTGDEDIEDDEDIDDEEDIDEDIEDDGDIDNNGDIDDDGDDEDDDNADWEGEEDDLKEETDDDTLLADAFESDTWNVLD